MFTTDLGNLYNRNIFKTSLYIYIFQDEKCRLMRNLSLSMGKTKSDAYSTKYSQAVTHPSTNLAQCCLTSVIGRELVFSTWYGRCREIEAEFALHVPLSMYNVASAVRL